MKIVASPSLLLVAVAALASASAACGDSGLPSGQQPQPDLAMHLPDLTMAKPAPDLTMAQPKPDLTMTTGPVDMTEYHPPVDASGVMCGSKTCVSGEQCCVDTQAQTATCAKTCPSGNITVKCDGPGNCGGNPCCADVQKGQIQSVMCTADPSACVPAIDPFTQSGMTRMCHVDADCVDHANGSQLRDCCTGMFNGQSSHFCFDKQFAGFTMGAVVCP